MVLKDYDTYTMCTINNKILLQYYYKVHKIDKNIVESLTKLWYKLHKNKNILPQK